MTFFFDATDSRGTTRRVAARQGQTCLDALYLAGLLPSRPLCAGMGRCGLCAMTFSPAPPPLDNDRKRISAEELAQGVRLACLHPAPIDGSVRLFTLFPETDVAEKDDKPIVQSTAEVENRILAVDLGTTTLEWRVEQGGDVLAQGRELNPQFGAGSEVMSRLAFAQREGPDALQSVLLRSLRAVLRDHGPVGTMSVAGNPAMIHLLLGLDCSSLASAPYGLNYAGDREEQVAADLPACYVPPLLSPFVGADLSAGLTALMYGKDGPSPVGFPFLLADMGTNGEFILALSEDDFWACSVPLGPALEGVGFPHGTMAGPETITGFDLKPTGLSPRFYGAEAGPSGAPHASALGITGTGYFSLLAGLLTARCLDEAGSFLPNGGPLASRLLSKLDKHEGEAYLPLPFDMALYASDVEEMLKVKAAFNLAVSELLEAAGLRPADLADVLLAGNMGLHVCSEDMLRLGFLPRVLSARIHAAGNTSLHGASLLCRDPEARKWARRMARRCRTLELAGDAAFGEKYLQRMRFIYV